MSVKTKPEESIITQLILLLGLTGGIIWLSYGSRISEYLSSIF